MTFCVHARAQKSDTPRDHCVSSSVNVPYACTMLRHVFQRLFGEAYRDAISRFAPATRVIFVPSAC